MCGRYATTRSAADLSALFEAYDETGGRLAADYNVAPTDPVPIVRVCADSAGSLLSVARWGLLPHWAKDTRGAARMINARAETVATTRAYAHSFARRRCLVPADGWYEWVRRDGGKQAYFMTPRDGGVLAFAGLWSVWHGAGDPLLTCSVVTTAALGELAGVHDRMPLLLSRQRWSDWLHGADDPALLLAPPDEKSLSAIEIRPVGRAVGDVRNDGPELIARVAAEPLRALPEEPAASTLF
ncbi:SOS response-associated peptidase [Plantactinospora sp. B6F1]|uniref:SOS response-associated peptidase family protein n=1 Tax=Plantactinospora sp. B6F1 TaxID=3158971 RepID=UPI00102B1681